MSITVYDCLDFGPLSRRLACHLSYVLFKEDYCYDVKILCAVDGFSLVDSVVHSFLQIMPRGSLRIVCLVCT